MNSPTLCLAVLALALPACLGESQPQNEGDVAQSSEALVIEGDTGLVYTFLAGFGHSLVGRDLNGQSFNGEVLDGHGVVGVSYEAMLASGPMRGLWLVGTRFMGLSSKGRLVTAKGMEGAVFNGTLDDASTLPLRIDQVELGSENSDVFYLVSYQTTEGWKPLCGTDDAGNVVRAIPLEGRWDYRVGADGGGSKLDDPTAFTFACEGYVLAKCVDMGYRPWRHGLQCVQGEGCEWVSLAPHHQACTRALRADYCGDGTSHTVDGVPINVYDAYEIRSDAEQWPIEAEWDADRARCLSNQRLEGEAPSCAGALESTTCGSVEHFTEGVLLLTEIAPG